MLDSDSDVLMVNYIEPSLFNRYYKQLYMLCAGNKQKPQYTRQQTKIKTQNINHFAKMNSAHSRYVDGVHDFFILNTYPMLPPIGISKLPATL